ncbi:MAG: PAS domain-containing protein, partial [Planctomycetota bacterium]
MRKNLPVTQQGHTLEPGATLMSTTDTKSRIRYANEEFVRISGFELEELVGQPHNMVRHPDMPPEAFRDMWETLKSGEAWAGLVKNRCKNGDFYWVKANVTPVTRDGRAAGYLSVRVAPTPEEVESAEHLYGEMREGRAEHLTMRKGVLLRKGLRSILDLPRTISFARRVRLPLAAVAVAAAYALFTSGASAEAWAAVAGTLAFTALWLESTVVRPVRALAEHSRAVATGAPDTRPVDRLDELGLVTRSVNQIAVMFRWIINDISSQVGAVR